MSIVTQLDAKALAKIWVSFPVCAAVIQPLQRKLSTHCSALFPSNTALFFWALDSEKTAITSIKIAMSNLQNGGKDERGVSTEEGDLKPSVQGKSEETPTTIYDIEEGKDAYRPGGFHPVFIGDVYNERYKVLRKIGYGQYSTVWLVKDLTLGYIRWNAGFDAQLTSYRDESEQQYKALKILSADSYGEKEESVFEREILTHLREADRTHAGYTFICHLEDNFEQQGPNGRHVCLVFELMGETLSTYRVWFKDQLLPHILMRKFTAQILMALDYAHDSGVIHTG